MFKLFENYRSVDHLKEEIMEVAFNTYDIEYIDFFVSRGYDIYNHELFYSSTESIELFEYMIDKIKENKKDINDFINGKFKDRLMYKFKNLEYQMILIDEGYSNLISELVGFNDVLKYHPDYSHIVKYYEDIDKYNI